MYRIESLDREEDDKRVLGLWYEYQIQKVDQYDHKIDQVLRRRGTKALVSWKGFGPKFNSWIPLESIRNLNQNDQNG